MAEINPKTKAPIVDLSWLHETGKLTESKEDKGVVSEQAFDSREKLSTLPHDHKIVVVLN